MARQLAEVFPPGDLLAEELEARSQTHHDFARDLGYSPEYVADLLSGKEKITSDVSAHISATLGTSPRYWFDLQASYDSWQQGQKEAQYATHRAELISRRPRVDPVIGDSIVGVLICAVIAFVVVWILFMFRDSIASHYDEAEKQVTGEISRQLDVEVLRVQHDIDGSTIDIRESDGATLRCEYTSDFDGHLYGCEETNVIG